MRFDWWTFGLQTINFAVLVWLLHRFLYKPVLRIIDARRAEVEGQFAEASAAEAKAKNELAAIEAERAGIAGEHEAALKTAAAQAEEAARRGALRPKPTPTPSSTGRARRSLRSAARRFPKRGNRLSISGSTSRAACLRRRP
ncbi:hypothetical protein RZS28_08775 [Methylocapsa polymorpha]|uniref:ATP synthase F(0) sector subunit b 2 n=1 Tax=Methylocapsa polymorpha TaxID=3080828 RepID=A0ABZ0HWP1_9HYPH|nr:hypothetical protein RZS28_08775 [Methylocapsa sp. RX1]